MLLLRGKKTRKISRKVCFGVILSIVVAIAAIYFLSHNSLEVSAKGEKYDNLISTSLRWSARHTIEEAERSQQKGDIGRAIVLYMSVEEKLADNHSDEATEMKVRSCMSRGDIYLKDNNYGDALKAYLKGIAISEDSSNEPHIARLYKNMSVVYGHFNDYEKAVSLALKGYNKAKERHDTTMMSALLNNISRLYVGLEKPAEARRYYTLLDKLNYAKSPQGKYGRDYTLAMVLRCEGKPEEALKRFHDLAS